MLAVLIAVSGACGGAGDGADLSSTTIESAGDGDGAGTDDPGVSDVAATESAGTPPPPATPIESPTVPTATPAPAAESTATPEPTATPPPTSTPEPTTTPTPTPTPVIDYGISCTTVPLPNVPELALAEITIDNPRPDGQRIDARLTIEMQTDAGDVLDALDFVHVFGVPAGEGEITQTHSSFFQPGLTDGPVNCVVTDEQVTVIEPWMAEEAEAHGATCGAVEIDGRSYFQRAFTRPDDGPAWQRVIVSFEARNADGTFAGADSWTISYAPAGEQTIVLRDLGPVDESLRELECNVYALEAWNPWIDGVLSGFSIECLGVATKSTVDGPRYGADVMVRNDSGDPEMPVDVAVGLRRDGAFIGTAESLVDPIPVGESVVVAASWFELDRIPVVGGDPTCEAIALGPSDDWWMMEDALDEVMDE